MSLTNEQLKWLYVTTGNEGWINAYIQLEQKENKDLAERLKDKSEEEQSEIQKKFADDAKEALESQERLLARSEREQNTKNETLLYVRQQVSLMQERIKKAFDQQIAFKKTAKKVVQDKTLKDISVFDDDNMGFDFMEDVHDIAEGYLKEVENAKEGEELARAQIVKEWNQASIDITRLELLMKDKGFEESEITKELYTPLVQQQVLPETFVPNAYSEVQKMIANTNKMYMKELEDAEEEETGFLAVKETIKDAVATSANIVLSSLDIAGVAGSLSESQVDLGKSITEIVSITSATALDTAELMIKGGKIKDAVVLILKEMSSAVGSIITTSMGGTDASEKIATYVSISMQMAASTIDVATSKDPKEAFIGAMKDMITKSLTIAITSKDDDPQTANILNLVQYGLQKSISAVEYGKEIRAKIEGMNPVNWKTVTSFALAKAIDMMNTGFELKGVIEQQKAFYENRRLQKELGGLDEAKDADKIAEIQAKIEENETIIGGGEEAENGEIADNGVTLEGLLNIQGESELEFDDFDFSNLELPDSAVEELEARNKEAALLVKKEDERLAENMMSEVESSITKQQEELEEQMALLQSIDQTAPSDKDIQTIDRLLAQMQKDRAIWDKVFSLMEKGATAAKVALTALGPGVVMIQLIKSITEVVVRSQEVMTWRDNQQDAKTVSNPYLTSVQGMLNQQSEHLTQASIQTALLCVKLAGEIMSLTPISPIGKIVSAASSIAMEAEEFIYKQFKKSQLKKAWHETKIALENPHFRRQNLYVRKLNPTLAKYTIAFGAVVAKDPIAVSTMNNIGVTTEMLENPSSGAEKVKKYLEERYNKDLAVKIRYTSADNWVPKLPPRNLEEIHWSMVYTKILENHAEDFDGIAALKNIAAPLKELHVSKKKFLEQADLDTVVEYIQSFSLLEVAWEKVDPKEVGQVETIKEEYLGLIQAEKENIQAMKNTIEKRLAMVDA